MMQFLRRFSLLVVYIYFCSAAFCQVGIGTKTPNSRSIVDVSSTTKGLFIPKLTAAQLNTLATTLTSSQKGMLVTDNTTGQPLCWDGAAWSSIANVSAKLPLVVSNTNQISINKGTAIGDLITWDGNNWINTQPAIQHFSYSVNNMQPYLVLNYCIAMQGIYPSRAGDEPFVSQVELFGFNFAPKGWAQCNGQLIPISQNTALFSLLGTYYGGDGRTNFGLPDLQGRVAIGFGQGPGLTDHYLGESSGIESEIISK